MSCIFVIAPAVVVAWPVLAGAVAAAAGTLGYKALNTGQKLDEKLEADRWVEISLKGSKIVADSMKRDSEFTIMKDDITATFKREADGRCIVHISGKNKAEAELQQAGQELLGRVTQQYAYSRVIAEMKNSGFTITNEEVAEDNTIRIHVSKFV